MEPQGLTFVRGSGASGFQGFGVQSFGILVQGFRVLGFSVSFKKRSFEVYIRAVTRAPLGFTPEGSGYWGFGMTLAAIY